MIEVNGCTDAGQGIEPLQVSRNSRIITEPSFVAFKGAVISNIKPDQRDEKPDIGFCQLLTEDKRAAIVQGLFKVVKGCKHRFKGFFVSDLTGRKAGLINAVVQVLVVILIEVVNFRLEGRWVKVNAVV